MDVNLHLNAHPIAPGGLHLHLYLDVHFDFDLHMLCH